MRSLLIRVASIAAISLACSPASVAQERVEPAPTLPVFEFHSGFWVNLHHHLYVQGRAHNAPGGANGPLFSGDEGATASQMEAWNEAVELYAQDWSTRDLLRNREMILANDRLAELDNCPQLSGSAAPECESGLHPALAEALNRAAPVYRARWWTEQDRANRAWIASVTPMVRDLGAQIAKEQARIYRRSWPQGPVRVDVVWDAGPLGAYTSLDPVHITIGSGDPDRQGAAALEILFHEASHALAGGVNEAIARECRQRNKPIPRDLWHALLFYTTGELVRRAFAADPARAPYPADGSRKGLYERGWGAYHDALERYWRPYLEGRLRFETAIARIIAAL